VKRSGGGRRQPQKHFQQKGSDSKVVQLAKERDDIGQEIKRPDHVKSGER
jgi:hypothetical protein